MSFSFYYGFGKKNFEGRAFSSFTPLSHNFQKISYDADRFAPFRYRFERISVCGFTRYKYKIGHFKCRMT
jgi:hypothetical protein